MTIHRRPTSTISQGYQKCLCLRALHYSLIGTSLKILSQLFLCWLFWLVFKNKNNSEIFVFTHFSLPVWFRPAHLNPSRKVQWLPYHHHIDYIFLHSFTLHPTFFPLNSLLVQTLCLLKLSTTTWLGSTLRYLLPSFIAQLHLLFFN